MHVAGEANLEVAAVGLGAVYYPADSFSGTILRL